MKPYRFSPIKDIQQLIEAITYIHFTGHKLCMQNLGHLLPVAGNIGIFCHFEDEFERLITIRRELTDNTVNWNQKYFRLYQPITIPTSGKIPQTTYSFLYIRKPDLDTPQVGDVDFYTTPDQYRKLKQSVLTGKYDRGVALLERPDIDMIKLFDPNIDVTAFIGSYNLEEITKHP